MKFDLVSKRNKEGRKNEDRRKEDGEIIKWGEETGEDKTLTTTTTVFQCITTISIIITPVKSRCGRVQPYILRFSFCASW